jgi:hypothetical protein
MADVMGWAKEHPYATGGIVLAVGVVVILIIYSGGSSQPQSNDAARLAAAQAEEAASGNALAAMQQQLQAQTNQTDAAVGANANNNATAVQVAEIQAQTSNNQATLQAQAASDVAKFNAEASETQSTMAANLGVAQSNNDFLKTLYSGILAMASQQSRQLADVSSPTAITEGYVTATPGGGYTFGVATIPNRLLYEGATPTALMAPGSPLAQFAAASGQQPPAHGAA